MGGVGGAFARHADEVAAAVPPQSQRLLRAIMTRLVTPEGTRAVVDHDELLELSRRRRRGRAHPRSARARAPDPCCTPIRMQGATVEIVHEVLITEWPTLARWLEDSQALRGFMHELRQAAKQWAARGKPRDLVWRGATAQEALATLKRHVLDLSAAEKRVPRRGSPRHRARPPPSRRRVRRRSSPSLARVHRGRRVLHDPALAGQRGRAGEGRRSRQGAERRSRQQLDEVKAAQAAREKAQKDAAREGRRSAEGERRRVAVEGRPREGEHRAAAEGAEAEKANAVAQELARVAQENAKQGRRREGRGRESDAGSEGREGAQRRRCSPPRRNA